MSKNYVEVSKIKAGFIVRLNPVNPPATHPTAVDSTAVFAL